MQRVSVFEEYRLIERGENEINGAWKGAHLLLFFMAFVFGSVCTFCFYMLMYLFDEKCVLFPKLLSLKSLHNNDILEPTLIGKETTDMMPVDFLNTQWIEKSACYLPTYVPLVSGIFGLIWTTMFLMCSTGNRKLTGLQRPWRILPPVFVFSLVMSGLCIYSSAVTHYGLQELCYKLSEVTGNPTCTSTISVATLAYERRIRGVYQATRLTIFSAWLHTACWVLSVLLTVARILLVVDFQLVRISAELIGDMDKILETHEIPLGTISPDVWFNTENDSQKSLPICLQTQIQIKDRENYCTSENVDTQELYRAENDLLCSSTNLAHSEFSLVFEERNRIAILLACQSVSKQHTFIVTMIYKLVENLNIQGHVSSFDENPSEMTIVRQYGQERISLKTPCLPESSEEYVSVDLHETNEILKEVKCILWAKLNKQSLKTRSPLCCSSPTSNSLSPKDEKHSNLLNITDELKETFEAKFNSMQIETGTEEMKTTKNYDLKQVGSQRDKKQKRSKSEKDLMSDSKSKELTDYIIKIDHETQSHIIDEVSEKYDKETQTCRKDKQD